MIVCPRCASPLSGDDLACTKCDFVAHNGKWFEFEPTVSIDSFFDELEFRYRFGAEPSHYWHRARRELLLEVVQQRVAPGSRVLEVGSGCGFLSTSFKAAGYDVWSADLSEAALGFGAQNGLEHLCRASITDLPFEDEFDAVGSFDVVEHIPDHERCVQQLTRALKKDGWMFLTVPAHPALWGSWDRLQHHVRRFRPAEFRQLLEGAGLEVLTLRQFFAALLLPGLAAALWDRVRGGSRREEKQVHDHHAMWSPPFVGWAAYQALAFEKNTIETKLPGVGTSLLAIARKR